MGTRGTQRSLCCHPLFSTGALCCPSTHIRYGRPGAKEPHAERPSPPGAPRAAAPLHFCSLPSSVAACSAHLGWPVSSSRPSVPSSAHLQPTSAPLFRLRPCCPPRGSAEPGSAGMPPPAGRSGPAEAAGAVPQCPVLRAVSPAQMHLTRPRHPLAPASGSPPVWGEP